MELHLCSSPFRVHVLPPGSIVLRFDGSRPTLRLHPSDQQYCLYLFNLRASPRTHSPVPTCT